MSVSLTGNQVLCFIVVGGATVFGIDRLAVLQYLLPDVRNKLGPDKKSSW